MSDVEKSVDRFGVQFYDGQEWLMPTVNGGFVRYADYAALSARLAEVEAENADLREGLTAAYLAGSYDTKNKLKAAEALLAEAEAVLTLWREYVASASEGGDPALFDAASTATAKLKGESDE